MRPNDRDYSRYGMIAGEDVTMTLDETALAHIMSVLTDLYSDPELAVIREYSTNARDSHLAAGQTRPIEVTTPTSLMPLFTVRDYGLGLSADDIRHIYSRYGASTKRETNDLQGMLGLGCKSALSLADQFTLEAVKDGNKVRVIVGRNEDGAGTMTILSEETTDEPNGVLVQVPAASGRAGEFEQKAKSFFSFWDEDAVLLNGKPPQRPETVELSDSIHLQPLPHSNYQLTGYVHMGGVPYPVDMNDYVTDRFVGRWTFHAFVDIGAVDFAPSREALQATPRTKRVIAQLYEDMKRLAVEQLRARIDAAPSKWEAVAAAKANNDIVSSFNRGPQRGNTTQEMKLAWRGLPIVMQNDDHDKGFVLWSHTTRKNGDRRGWMPTGALDKTAVFINYPGSTWTETRKEKARRYLESKGVTGVENLYGIRPGTTWHRDWCNPDRIFRWEDADAIPVNTAQLNPRTQTVEGYRVSKPGQYAGNERERRRDFTCDIADRLPADQFPKGRIAYAIGSDKSGGMRWDGRDSMPVREILRTEQDALTKALDDVTIVVLPENRLKKFMRLFPKARPLYEIANEEREKIKRAIPEEVLYGEYIIHNHTYPALFTKEEAEQLLDKRFLRVVQYMEAARNYPGRAEVHADMRKPVDDPLVDYPLVRRAYNRYDHKDHIMIYINAVYAANNKEDSNV
jgi:hypothetical protein